LTEVSFILWELAEVVIDFPKVKVCSDPGDDKFLAAAVAGGTDDLVSGDVADLLRLHRYKDVTIVSPREFVSVLKSRALRGA
jgi:predicted nucleic acid-binding protein